MIVHLFMSGIDPDVVGFTTDASGANLPPQFAPWQQSGSAMQIGSGEVIAGVASSDAVIRGVQRDGHHLVRGGGIKLTEATVPQ